MKQPKLKTHTKKEGGEMNFNPYLHANKINK